MRKYTIMVFRARIFIVIKFALIFLLIAGCVQFPPSGTQATDRETQPTTTPPPCGMTDSGPNPCPIEKYPPDLAVYTVDSVEAGEVNITIINSKSDVVYSKNVSIPAGPSGRVDLKDVVSQSGNYTIIARIGNSTGRADWDVESTVPWDGAIYWVKIYADKKIVVEKIPTG